MIVRPWRQPLMRMSLSRNVTSDNLAVEDNFTQRQSDNLAVSGDVGAQGGGFDPPLCSTGRYRGQSVPHTSHGTSIPVSHSSQDVRNDRYFYISGLDNENHGRGVSHIGTLVHQMRKVIMVHHLIWNVKFTLQMIMDVLELRTLVNHSILVRILGTWKILMIILVQ